MNPSPVKIIVVHWKWQENLCYPRLYASPGQEANAKAGDPVSEFQWTYFQKGTVPFIPVYEKDSQENEQPVPDKRLLPTSLSKYLKLLDIETTPFPKFYIEQIIESIQAFLREEDREPPKLQLLFLFHRGEGFDSVKGREDIQHTLDKIQSNSLEEEIKYAFFGAGEDMIYREEGFLDIGAPTFRFKGKNKAGQFDPDKKRQILALRQDLFDSTWEYYWFQTRKRLSEIRRLFGLYQVSIQMENDQNVLSNDVDIDNLAPDTKKIAQHLLYYIEGEKDIATSKFSDFQSVEPEEINLAEAFDFKRILKESDTQTFIKILSQQLHNLIQDKKVEWPLLHESLKALIALFNK